MYIYADWFPDALLNAEAAGDIGEFNGTGAAGRGGRVIVSPPIVKTSQQQAIVNTTRTLTWLLEILYEEFREVYTVIQERLKLERERNNPVPA